MNTKFENISRANTKSICMLMSNHVQISEQDSGQDAENQTQ